MDGYKIIKLQEYETLMLFLEKIEDAGWYGEGDRTKVIQFLTRTIKEDWYDAEEFRQCSITLLAELKQKQLKGVDHE